MLKKLMCLLLSGALAFAFCGVTAAPLFAADATDVQEIDYFEDGGTYNLAVGGTLDLDNGVPAVVSGSEHVSVAENGTVTGVSAGDAVLQWSSDWGDETATVHVYAGTVSTAKRTVYAAYNEYGDISASLTLATPGADAHSTFAYEGDSLDASYAYTDAEFDDEKHAIVFSFSRTGTHVLSFALDGKCYQVTVSVVGVKMSPSFAMLYKGKTKKLSANAGLKASSWKSSKSSVATVSRSGKVTAKKKGIATISARVKGITVKCRVEVTSKKAYQAVKNGLKDSKTKLTYSQSKRMKKKYRDCSSFVSRCYWDSTLKRKIFAIGGNSAKSWAYNAAAQAKWLNAHKRCVAKKAVSANKLLPGDTIYYETDYAGKNKQYRHIDHAALYIGNGLVLQTGHYDGTAVGVAYYWAGDPSVKFIGRPVK